MLSPRELGERLRARASELGFDLVGVARAGRLERDAVALADWLAAGRHAGMSWMSREPTRRADPTNLLEGCRSVVTLAVNYWPGAARAETVAGAGRVALYARARDYHRVLGRAARALAGWLEEATGLPARSFVDTGPVLERAWAERAGIGWIGKNANLISRHLGSWLLLAEVLTCADIEPAAGPHEGFCGTCNACIEACPTGAIVAEGVVDSNRCISYWTIEHRGPVPEQRRAGMGEWIFGCDECQTCCPWNESFSRPYGDDTLGHREDLGALDPREVARLGEGTFRERYSGTPLMRARWEGMRRNACIVLGNRRDPDEVPVLGPLLGDDDPVVRLHAAWALGRIGGPAARRWLEDAGQCESERDVLTEIRRALAVC